MLALGKFQEPSRDAFESILSQTKVENLNVGHTEELLAGAALLHNLNETGLKLLNGGNVVGKDTHLTRFGGDVDLDTVSSERFISMHLQVGDVGTPKKHGTLGSGQDARLTYTPVELKMVYYRIYQ